jgi:hypothetical protein
MCLVCNENIPNPSFGGLTKSPANKNGAKLLAIFSIENELHPVADPESFLWVGTQYRNSAPQYATVLATVLRYLGHRESGVVLGLPKTLLGPPLTTSCLTIYGTSKWVMNQTIANFRHVKLWQAVTHSDHQSNMTNIYLPFAHKSCSSIGIIVVTIIPKLYIVLVFSLSI